jgi:putative DNA primase/helicase
MASEPVERVLALLKNVVNGTDGWTARCPAHSDHVNSLSIGEGSDGKALLFCHVGCDINQIVDSLGIRVRDLFPSRRRRTR